MAAVNKMQECSNLIERFNKLYMLEICDSSVSINFTILELIKTYF